MHSKNNLFKDQQVEKTVAQLSQEKQIIKSNPIPSS